MISSTPPSASAIPFEVAAPLPLLHSHSLGEITDGPAAAWGWADTWTGSALLRRARHPPTRDSRLALGIVTARASVKKKSVELTVIFEWRCSKQSAALYFGRLPGRLTEMDVSICG